MKLLIVIQTILLLSQLRTLAAAIAPEPATVVSASGQRADASAFKGLQAFLGAPLSLPIQQLWKGGGSTSIVTAQDGAMVAFQSLASNMIRLPVDGLDILLYSNLDTDAGRMPDQVGASITKEREKITVWASFNGGKTWPVKRLVFDGPCGYSNLAVGRAGTPGAGRIYLLFEGGAGGRRAGIQVAVFNLSWLLTGREPSDLLDKRLGSK
jgi:hypothetical protein